MVFESDGARLHYEVFGEGEPLLWVHGFMGMAPERTGLTSSTSRLPVSA